MLIGATSTDIDVIPPSNTANANAYAKANAGIGRNIVLLGPLVAVLISILMDVLSKQ